jgi:dihydropteroate synthase
VFPTRKIYSVPIAHGGVLHLGERTLVMGILNLTPDSFAEAQILDTEAAAVDAALRMQDQGADLLDVGGESTRPGAAAVSAAEELARVLPVIRALAGKVRIPISVDTYKAEVARTCLSEGAAIVNDISGLRYDPPLAEAVAESGAALVLMHNRGRSAAMYTEANYQDVAGEVTAELGVGVAAAIAAGVSRDHLIIDPGIGFAKRPAHSYGVLAHLSEIAAALDRPVLVGPSRKSFMSAALDQRPPLERDWGTAAAVAAAVLSGVHIVRVHAVGEMAQVVRVAEAIRTAQGAEHGT